MTARASRRRSAAWLWLTVALAPVVPAGCALVGIGGFRIPDWADPLDRVLWQVRGARVAAGFTVGAALAGAGTVLQALLRNPLADPYILGVSGGAALGAALAIVCGMTGAALLAGNAFAFALLALAAVYLLGRRPGAPSLYGMLLSGVIVSAMCSSLLMLIMVLAPVEGLHSITWWMLGNLQVGSPPLLGAAALLTALALAGLWLLARDFNALTLGTDMAYHLGVSTRRAVALGLGLATLMTAAAVALAGIIGFVGLIVPHVMRGLVGPDHRRLIPAAALAGGLLLVVCDTLGRTLVAPLEIPVGVITALAGGPFFLALLRRRRGWIA